MAPKRRWGKRGQAIRAVHVAKSPSHQQTPGLHPELTLDWYCEMLRGLKQRFPKVHLKAFTMVEIGFLAKRTKISTREILERLRDAGMDSLPGGGAEIFNERVRRIICDHKIDGGEWIETARTAHQLGLRSNCTMLYGHIENDEDRVDHLVRLRALQDETHGFVTYIPLAFHPDNTPLQHISKTTGFADIKNIAVARLMLDNIPHIKAYWVMMTPRIAQIALRFGADDIDGTIVVGDQRRQLRSKVPSDLLWQRRPRRLSAVPTNHVGKLILGDVRLHRRHFGHLMPPRLTCRFSRSAICLSRFGYFTAERCAPAPRADFWGVCVPTSAGCAFCGHVATTAYTTRQGKGNWAMPPCELGLSSSVYSM